MKNKLLLALSGLALIAAGLFMMRTMRRGEPAFDVSADICLGERLAKEAAKLLESEGDLVAISPAGGKFTYPVAEAQMKGFRRGLATVKRVRLVAVEGPDEDGMQELSEMQFTRVLSKYPAAKAIVSFMGVPPSSVSEAKSGPTKLPKVLALDLSGKDHWKLALTSGVVQVVIAFRSDANWANLPQKGDCKLLFDSRYRVITGAELEAMR